MIRRIIFYFLTFDLFLALYILMIWQANGIQVHNVRIGTELIGFLHRISVESSVIAFLDFHIPAFIEIPYVDSANPLVIANAGIWIVNSLLSGLNLFIWLANSFIETLTFFRILFSNFSELYKLIAGV